MPAQFSISKLLAAIGLGALAYFFALYALHPTASVFDHWDSLEVDNIIAGVIAACCFAAILWRLLQGGGIDDEVTRMRDVADEIDD